MGSVRVLSLLSRSRTASRPSTCRRPSREMALGGGRAHLDHQRTTAGGDGGAPQTWSVRCSSLFPSSSTPSKRPATRLVQSTRSRTQPSSIGTTTAGDSSPQLKISSEPPGSSVTSAMCCQCSSGWSGGVSHTSTVTAVVPNLRAVPIVTNAPSDHRCASYPASVVASLAHSAFARRA
jgi:hypothetical protein